MEPDFHKGWLLAFEHRGAIIRRTQRHTERETDKSTQFRSMSRLRTGYLYDSYSIEISQNYTEWSFMNYDFDF